MTWLILFTLGMTIDSEKYRRILSEGGAEALSSPPAESARLILQTADTVVTTRVDGDTLHIQMPEPLAPAASEAYREPEPQGSPQIPDPSTAPESEDSSEQGTQPGSEPSDGDIDTASGGSDGDGTRSTSALGNADPAQPEQLASWSTIAITHFWALIVVVLVFTPPNLALLSCLAGVLGVIGRYAVLTANQKPSPSDRTFPLLSAVLRGFVVYLIVISGMLVLLENPILGTVSPGQYVRFAGLLSLTSFYVNYDPNMFAELLDRVRDRIQEESPPEETSSHDRETGTPENDENEG